MRKNHKFEVPEHPVIWAMERYGEYPVPEKKQVRDGEEDHEKKTVYVLSVDL